MSPVTIGIICFAALFTLIAIGLPVGFGMALVGFGGLWFLISEQAAMIKMGLTPFDTIANYSLSVLPLFLFMAQITFVSGLSKDLYNLASKWLGHQPGGVAMATVGACAGFAAVSASSLATASTMGLVAIPEMKRQKYDPALATGCVAAGGTMGSLIPPSGVLIIYGIITETSIGKLFMGGMIPGILEAIFYMATIYILCTWKPSLGPRGTRYSLTEKFAAFKGCVEIIGLIILVLGGLIIGWFTPTEAGAVGAFGAIVFSLFRKRLTWQKFLTALMETIKTTGMIYGILIGAMIFNYFVAITTIPTVLSDFVGGLPLAPLAIIGLVMVVYLILGCFIDASAMMLLTLPVFFPLAMSLGFDPVWFGIITVRAIEIAMITPPIGINVYVISGVAPDVPLQTIFKGIIPFLIADLLHVTLLLLVPSVVLFLPNLVR
ncbi:MAG TPA: TRAP transporter large permease subunit [Dehalococcoidales bacterium]|nr:TRAP transporter large permease subunit [Dehalococcoidales bacterium]